MSRRAAPGRRPPAARPRPRPPRRGARSCAGAVHEPVFVPLLAGCAVAGLAAQLRARAAREGRAVPPSPGPASSSALHALVLLQLVPLPPALLRVVSPGSFSFYNDPLLVPLAAWRPISVSPPDTLRGLAFLAGFSLLSLAVFRELGDGPVAPPPAADRRRRRPRDHGGRLRAGRLARAARRSTASGARAGTGPSSAPT